MQAGPRLFKIMRLCRNSCQRAEHGAFHHTAGGYVEIKLAGDAVDSDEAFPFQMQNDLLGTFLG
jgi:hypothetical protein